MTALLRTILSEIIGLFVDDGLLAGGTVILVALALALGASGAATSPLAGPALFAGLAVLLALSVWQRARR